MFSALNHCFMLYYLPGVRRDQQSSWADWGQIAGRIVRACAEFGVKSVAIYSNADRSALHAKKADEAYNIGPDPGGRLSRCSSHRQFGRYCRCDALHPGYGFLVENPQLP